MCQGVLGGCWKFPRNSPSAKRKEGTDSFADMKITKKTEQTSFLVIRLNKLCLDENWAHITRQIGEQSSYYTGTPVCPCKKSVGSFPFYESGDVTGLSAIERKPDQRIDYCKMLWSGVWSQWENNEKTMFDLNKKTPENIIFNHNVKTTWKLSLVLTRNVILSFNMKKWLKINV